MKNFELKNYKLKNFDLQKYLCISLVMLLACTTLASCFAEATETAVLAVDPSSYEVDAIGKNVTIPITVTDVTDLWICSFSVNWNPSILNLTDAIEGDFLKRQGDTLFIWDSINQTALNSGYLTEISVGALTPETVSGDGVLVSLVFQVVGYGTSQITLSNTHFISDSSSTDNLVEIDHSVSNGQVIVSSSASPSSSTSNMPSSTESASPSSSDYPSSTTTPSHSSNTSPMSSDSLVTGPFVPDFYLILTVVVVIVGVCAGLVIFKISTRKGAKN